MNGERAAPVSVEPTGINRPNSSESFGGEVPSDSARM